MSARAAFLKWSVIGAAAAGLLLTAQAAAVGGWAGLLQVGDASALRPIIEAELGALPSVPGPGHDGQIYYAMALDLDGDRVGPLLDHAGYRYRRILFPLLASGFGLLGGEALLYGMVAVVVASTALASGTVGAFAAAAGKSDWSALAVLLNPGVWLSVRLLTADVLALTLMIGGLYWLGRRRPGSIASFALSSLTKDVFLVTPLALAVARPRRRWLTAAVSVSALVAWMAWITVVIGDGFAPRGNLTLPFLGIVESAPRWVGNDVEGWVYIVFALVAALAALVVGAFRRSWLRWPLLAWGTLAVVSSSWVWDFGNNAARAFVAIPVLAVLSYLPEPGSTGDGR